MRTSEDIKGAMAKFPIAVTSAATTYNGEAVASADGIDVRGKGVALVDFIIGAIGVSSLGVSYALSASALSTGNQAADIVDIVGAAVAILPANANTKIRGSLDIAAMPEGKHYLYVKRVQASADSVLDCIAVNLTDGNEQPAGETLAFNVH